MRCEFCRNPAQADSDDVAGDRFRTDPDGAEAGTGSEAYAPLARAIIGGLIASVAVTIFIVPAAYVLVYGRRRPASAEVPS